MMIEFECDCGHQFRTHLQNAGRDIICPNCTTSLKVPQVSIRGDLKSRSVGEFGEVSSPSAWPIKGKSASTRQKSIDVKKSEGVQVERRSQSAASAKSPRMPEPSKPPEVVFDLSDIDSFEDDEEEVEVELILDASELKRRKSSSSKRRTRDQIEDEDAATRKSDHPNHTNLPLVIVSLVAGVAVMVGVGFLVVPSVMSTIRDLQTIKVPNEFEKYVNNEMLFRCEVPANWEVEARGGTGSVPPSVRIERGRIKISYRASPSGAAIQDIAQASVAGADNVADSLKPVSRVHEYQQMKIKAENPDYREIGEPERIDTGWGEGRISTFVGNVGFGGRSYGYRVTLLTTNFQWNVICRCPSKREFEAFQPVFRKIIESTGK